MTERVGETGVRHDGRDESRPKVVAELTDAARSALAVANLGQSVSKGVLFARAVGNSVAA